ncbi:MAG: DUF4202 domain-containing protein [Marinagarivorans sp.]|nr:DUF4202 domain-containing protein [Marinagarivorans sp.]
MTHSVYSQTIALIDAANSQDPNSEVHDGNNAPKELLYSQRMTATLTKFNPEASELLHIAARGQHIERWTSLRSDYPEGRTGYKQWRAELGLFHAKRVAELMAEAGYDDDACERAKYITQKRSIKRDDDSQCLEDVACLVFIEHYMAAFANKSGYDEAKLIDIIQKTWAKMSDKGHAAALQLPLDQALLDLIGKALS